MSDTVTGAVHTARPWQTKHDNSLEGRATIIANIDGEIIEGSNHYTYDTVAICADEFGEYLPDADKNARLIVAACNSYQRHTCDPISAAEGDLLGRCLDVIQKCEAQFLKYAENHRAKGTGDGDLKAVTNEHYAHLCGSILSQAQAREVRSS